MIIKTEGIVIKSMDFRETSKIATFYTRDWGKMKGVLKGIRKDPKKFGSYVDKFSLNEFVYYRYNRSDLHLISQCDLKQYYFPIRQDLKRNMAANYACELVDSIMATEMENKYVYQLLIHFLDCLEYVEDVDKLVYIFQIRMLRLSGFSPHLDSCVVCRKRIQGKSRFSLKSGGLICPVCPSIESTFTFISPGTISTILHIERNSWRQCIRLGISDAVKRELKYILNNFLVYHLEKKIKTAKYL